MAREYACSLERFQKDTADHVMEVVHDNGMHRHLRFRKPGTYCMGFDIVTWPGYLAISGDMGASVFSRLPDMFEFFRVSEKWNRENPDQLAINVSYWSEKIVANDGPKEQFSSARLEQIVKERYDEFMAEQDSAAIAADDGELWREIGDQVLCAETTEQAIVAMSGFEGGTPALDEFRFSDAWEYGSSLEEPTFHLIWRLYAIAYAVRAYDALRAQQGALLPSTSPLATQEA